MSFFLGSEERIRRILFRMELKYHDKNKNQGEKQTFFDSFFPKNETNIRWFERVLFHRALLSLQVKAECHRNSFLNN